MKPIKRSLAVRIRDALRRDAFRIEPLEPRVLLNADPLLAPLKLALLPDRNDIQSLTEAYAASQVNTSPYISVPLVARLLSSPAATGAAQTFAVDAVLFDIGQMAARDGFLNANMMVAANEVLGGKAQTTLSLLNAGTVSPGHSPGVVTVATYTQTPSGTLEIELGGATAGDGAGHYDQLNVTGQAILDGTLSIQLIDGFKPVDGQSFTVMNFGSATGKFDVGSGLLRTDSDLYFEVTQGNNSLVLTAHTLDPSIGYILGALGNEPGDQIGQWLNFDYFQDVAPVTFAGTLDLAGALSASGTFTLGYDADESLSPNGGSPINTNVWTLHAENTTAFLGSGGKGLTLSNLDLDLAFVEPSSAGATYGWVMAKGLMDGASVTGIDGLTLQGTNLALDLGLGYGNLPTGAANDALLDLSQHALNVGSSVFDGDGSGGEYVLASGTLTGSVQSVSLTATVGVSVLGSDFVIAGSEASASLVAGGVSVGVVNGAFGLVQSTEGLLFEASGSLALSGGGFGSVNADLARVVVNRTGALQTGRVLQFAGDFSYAFGDVPASSNLQAVGVTGLTASLGEVLSVSGNFYFERDAVADAMRIVAESAGAQVESGTFVVGVQDTTLGLSISSAGRIVEARGGLYASLGGEISLSADEVSLRMNETTGDASGLAMTAAGHAYTFGSDLGAGTREIGITGAQLSLAGFV